jgi:hypothetical protein
MDLEKAKQTWHEKKIGTGDYSEMVNLAMALTNTAKVIKSRLRHAEIECDQIEAAEFAFFLIGEHKREEDE